MTHFASEEGRSTRDVTFGVVDCDIVTLLTRSTRVEDNRKLALLKDVEEISVLVCSTALLVCAANIDWGEAEEMCAMSDVECR